MHTRIIPDEPKSENVSTKNQSGFENVSFDLQGILAMMKKLIQNQLNDQKIGTVTKIFNGIAHKHATRIF